MINNIANAYGKYHKDIQTFYSINPTLKNLGRGDLIEVKIYIYM